jgi:hypothetical protein
MVVLRDRDPSVEQLITARRPVGAGARQRRCSDCCRCELHRSLTPPTEASDRSSITRAPWRLQTQYVQ